VPFVTGGALPAGATPPAAEPQPAPPRAPASLTWSGRHSFVLDYSVPPVPAAGAGEEGEAPSPAPPAPSDIYSLVAAKWAQVAAEVAKAGESGGGIDLGQTSLRDAIQSASEQTLLAHGLSLMGRARVTVLLALNGGGGGGGEAAAPAASQASPRRARFSRIDPAAAAGRGGDALTGLFVGQFGTCGPEVLQISRGMWGEETMGGPDAADYITAMKLTGDRNVAAGLPSFRARVSPSCRLAPGDLYPPELGVLARYPGQGLAGLPGAKAPMWVPGELLILDGGSGPERSLCCGARIAFLWTVPDRRNFLIVFHRLQLPGPGQ
jgi:hypothetical protein